MSAWLWALISVGSSTLVTTVIGVVFKYIITKQLDKKKRIEEIIEEQKRQERKKTIIDSIREEVAPMKENLKEVSNDVKKISEGTLSSLRNDILTCYYRCNEKGYRNDYDYTNIHDLYKAYTELHGNSFVADIMDRFDKLPTKEVYKRNKDIEDIKNSRKTVK